MVARGVRTARASWLMSAWQSAFPTGLLVFFLLLATGVFADDNIQVMPVRVDCWSTNICPFWNYSLVQIIPNWSTTCSFTDPLPAGTKLLKADGVAWSGFFGHTGQSTIVRLKMNDDVFLGGELPFSDSFESQLPNICRLTSHSNWYTLDNPQSYVPGGLNHVTVYGPGYGYPGSTGGWLEIQNVDLDLYYTVAPTLVVQASIVNAVLTAPQESQPLVADPEPVAHVPLGATLELTVAQSTRTGIPEEITWSLSDTDQKPPITGEMLFDNDVLKDYDSSNPKATARFFQAVHLGTTRITMVPTDTALPTRKLKVEVYAPTYIGLDHHTLTDGTTTWNLDAKIVEWANPRGLPPQAVKATIRRETNFDPMDYRYEPLSTDWEDFSPNGLREREQARYAPYRMEYDMQHLRGASLVNNEDVHPRSVFYKDYQARIKFTNDAETDVTAYQIYSQNDDLQNWYEHAKSTVQTRIDADEKAALAWTAQTTLASSYGLMQVLFSESFAHGYQGVAGSRRPYYLFDIPLNVASGGGSIQVGTGVQVSKYNFANGNNEDFKTPNDFNTALMRMFSCYNGCSKPRNSTVANITDYGRKVRDYMKTLYFVMLDRSIF